MRRDCYEETNEQKFDLNKKVRSVLYKLKSGPGKGYR